MNTQMKISLYNRDLMGKMKDGTLMVRYALARDDVGWVSFLPF